ncbi:MAG TPA: molecular chaperone [Bacillota bacterium]
MPSYRLNVVTAGSNRRYKREDLLEMTTLQLRNICYREKIVKGVVNTLDREGLIRTILKYRGEEKHYLINAYREAGFERVGDALRTCLMTRLPDHDKIKIPAKITLYQDIGITEEDMYKVSVETEIGESNVLLLNDQKVLCGIFNLVRAEHADEANLYYLVAEAHNLNLESSNCRNYHFLFFKKDDSEYLFKTYYSDKLLPPANLEYFKVPVVDLEIKRMQETAAVLAIDFGTSNTTAGAYLSNNYIPNPCFNDILNRRIELNQINIVKFKDVTSKSERWLEVLPTVVYVANCADPNQIKYYFGYEAKSFMKRNNYTSNSSIFQGIKRWVNNYQKIEEIYDESGNVAKVKRGEIIRAYLLHVIEAAERQFKCRFRNLHISSPVKLKQQFIEMFREILPEYNIASDDALDEGIAVLYNTIADQIEKNKFIDGEEYKALVIDCGGGTTDLSSCSFRIEEGQISYKIEVRTTFENGDTNFGGNNITYRILQFMKIVFAEYYRSKKILDIDSLIDIPSADIFRIVDELGVAKVYEHFEQCYAEAEQIIPTRFKEYENRVSEDYQRVKNNFYFLWEIADNMKKEFFQKTNILRNRFDASEMNDQESDLHITTLNKWCLSILKDGNFKDVFEFPDVVFNIKEINKLIKGDIYEVVRKFLEKYYENRELQDYSIIKLTGQSCRIDIFKEALKEFVPGKSIEFKQRNDDDEIVPDLKLACLKGVLRFINSKKIGDIEATIINDIPVIPYSVSALTYNKQEKMLIYSLDKMNQAKGFISRPIGVEEIRFYLKNQEGVLKQEFILENNFESYNLTYPEEITNQYPGKIFQEDTDTISNGEVRFFLFAHERNWGFHVVPIARHEDQLYIGHRKYFAFEDELSELDFFDGLK